MCLIVSIMENASRKYVGQHIPYNSRRQCQYLNFGQWHPNGAPIPETSIRQAERKWVCYIAIPENYTYYHAMFGHEKLASDI